MQSELLGEDSARFQVMNVTLNGVLDKTLVCEIADLLDFAANVVVHPSDAINKLYKHFLRTAVVIFSLPLKNDSKRVV
jgi:hypothetical protein